MINVQVTVNTMCGEFELTRDTESLDQLVQEIKDEYRTYEGGPTRVESLVLVMSF
jgi:hypothetical protein